MRWGFLAIIVMLLFPCLLAGCGGGGSSSASVSKGSVRGTINAASLEAGTTHVSVALDGKNLSTSMASDGSFVLDNVPAGVYTLVARAGNRAAELVVQVSGRTVTNVGQISLNEAGQIAGMVTDANSGAPLGGVLVTVTAYDTASPAPTPQAVRTCTTSTTGSYLVDALPAGDYLVTLSDAGYGSATLELTVSAGTTTTGDMALSAISATAGTLQGVVSGVNSDQSVTPLSGVYIVVSNGAIPLPPQPVPVQPMARRGKHKGGANPGPIPPPGQVYYTYSANDGSYQITGIPAGTYTVQAMRDGFSPASQSVTITAQQTTTLSLQLSIYQIPMGTVSGTVTDASSNLPIPGATVSAAVYCPGGGGVSNGSSLPVTPTVGTNCLMAAITDGQGHYTLQVPTAISTICCTADGYVEQDPPITLSNGQTLTVNIALVPTPVNPNTQVTLSGKVTTYQAGPPGTNYVLLAPVAGATVYLISMPANNSEAPSRQYTATTDSSGAYSMTVPSDNYTAYAQANGMVSDSSQLQLYQDTTQDFDLFYPPTPTPTPVPMTQRVGNRRVK